jgi:dihydroflavonol-4-reductase
MDQTNSETNDKPEVQDRVLVTGATGFIAMHTILLLLEQGYRVRGTVRSLDRSESLRATLANHTARLENLELVAADLMMPAGATRSPAVATSCTSPRLFRASPPKTKMS